MPFFLVSVAQFGKTAPLMLARQHLHTVNHAITCLQAHPDPIGQDVLDEMHQSYHLEVVAPLKTLAGTDPDPFIPTPETWRSMMRLPDTIKKHWVESLKKEIKALISKETFVPETPRPDDVITPVTAKFRVSYKPPAPSTNSKHALPCAATFSRN
jgi:hypothetical protein